MRIRISGDDIERDVTQADISRMKYLDQVIREVLRLLPTVPIIGRVISEETEIGGFIIPKGVTAMIPPFAVQRDRRVRIGGKIYWIDAQVLVLSQSRCF